MPKMDNSCDFIYWLSPDMSIEILTHLDDPSDLVRVSAVSRLWHRFVIENGLCGQLCLKMLPEVSNAANVINNKIEPLKVNVNSTVEWECLRKRHRVYSFLARGLSPVVRKDCISEAISASSTDNYPEESIQNTLEPRDRIQNRASYWSSKGERDPAVPEILLYKLIAKLSVITEIHVQPFQAYFQYGFPIYSPRAIRFRVGHLQNQVEFGGDVANSAAANAFIWTYTSPEFPMVQGKFVEVSLVIEFHSLAAMVLKPFAYGGISHVQVVGKPLSPGFEVEMVDHSGNCTLRYYRERDSSLKSSEEVGEPSRFLSFTARLMSAGWERRIWNRILATGPVASDDDESEDELTA
ncbi:hypothetical protein FEM48_Zijuj03G0150600 [Ziziphus jujuba var. spinosa]|uniref:F-box domain-containing protein n=1 Tax=Ziziphus jujuba var. spinosa TaxID=714518 RepID=A0A978VR04_ZIZJJ|nr:hypothetical protein FEM48_Zijuj03G0150600 [Ziziphus jujuba var. spinosa]